MSEKRPKKLEGATYKIKTPEYQVYVTINDIIIEGEMEPYEIFIRCEDPGVSHWTSAVSRVLSALLREGGEYKFIVDELKQVQTPEGGFWYEGEYMSTVAAIGHVIEGHFIDRGYVNEINK